MGFPSKEEIERLRDFDLGRLAELDASGLIPAPGESLDAFCGRLSRLSSRYAALEGELSSKGRLELLPGLVLGPESKISPEILAEAASITEGLYKFRIDWVPGFFLSEGVGALWGGCAISFPEGHSVFLVRSSFAARRRWFIYDRDELLSHELCHVARAPLMDRPFEEHFAYQTAKSRLRRYMGNCFQSRLDALIFIVPVFILLGAQMLRTFTALEFPAWPFWLAAGAAPLWLLVRNAFSRRTCFKAGDALREIGCKDPRAMLFRCAKEEIREIASLRHDPAGLREFVMRKAGAELRWSIMKFRFMETNPITGRI